jgi:hypothetical protein
LRQEERERQPRAEDCRSFNELAPGQATDFEIFVRS